MSSSSDESSGKGCKPHWMDDPRLTLNPICWVWVGGVWYVQWVF